MPSGNIKHGKFIVELRPLYSIFKEVKFPQFATAGARDLDNAPFTMGWSLISASFVMIPESCTHEYDEYFFFVGGDPTNVYESFDGEVEFGLEGVIQSINYPACIYIPKGTLLGPCTFKRVTKPIMFTHALISPSLAGG